MRTVFFDIETTGFSRDHCDIIDLAAVFYDTETNEQFEIFNRHCKPRGKIPKKIVELTGITDAMVADAAAPWDVLNEFFSVLHAYKVTDLVAHNGAVFDWPFIKAQCEKFHLVFPDLEIHDTLKLCRNLKKEHQDKFNPPDLKQPTLAHYFNIDYVPHTALDDCTALVAVWKKLSNLTSELGYDIMKM